MTAITQAVTEALFHFIWQGALVAFLLWMTLFLLRRNSANARYGASCAAMALFFVLPVWTAWSVFDASTPVAAQADVKSGLVTLPDFTTVGGGIEGMSWIAAANEWAITAW